MQAEKAQHYVRKAVYGCCVPNDGPYDALYRDAELGGNVANAVDTSSSGISARQVLDGLVDTQRKAQLRTRIQLASIEKQFHKV